MQTFKTTWKIRKVNFFRQNRTKIITLTRITKHVVQNKLTYAGNQLCQSCSVAAVHIALT